MEIQEFLNYLKQNNKSNDLSNYFVTYIQDNHPSEYEEFITPSSPDIDLETPTLVKSDNPIVSNKRTFNIKPYENTLANGNVSSLNFKKVNIPINKSKTGKYIVDFFINKGLTKEQASGIAGNLYHESGFKTSVEGDKHLSTPSVGIAQWREGRLKGLKDFASSINKNYSDLDTQLEYIWKELNTTEFEAMKHLKNSKSVKEAAENFAHKYERMKTYTKHREDNANYFYNLS